MKKIVLLLGIVSLVLLSSCCNGKKGDCQKTCSKEEKKEAQMSSRCCKMSDEQKNECVSFQEKWVKFDSLSVEEQKELIAKKKDFIDKREAEIKAARDSFDAKWTNFKNLTIAEQKALLDQKDGFMKCPKFRKGSKCCPKK